MGKIGFQGKFGFSPDFWNNLEKIVSAPQVAERLAQALEKKKALEWYDIREYDLSEARDNERITNFPSEGDCLLVLEITEGATAHSELNTEFSLADNRKFRHKFDVLYLSNTEQDGATLKLLFGKGDWDVEKHYSDQQISAINADMVDGFHARRY